MNECVRLHEKKKKKKKEEKESVNSMKFTVCLIRRIERMFMQLEMSERCVVYGGICMFIMVFVSCVGARNQ